MLGGLLNYLNAAGESIAHIALWLALADPVGLSEKMLRVTFLSEEMSTKPSTLHSLIHNR